MKLKVDKDEITIEEGEDSFMGKMIAGAQKRIVIKTPFGEREIHKVKDIKGRVFKDDKKPENVGKVEKP